MKDADSMKKMWGGLGIFACLLFLLALSIWHRRSPVVNAIGDETSAAPIVSNAVLPAAAVSEHVPVSADVAAIRAAPAASAASESATAHVQDMSALERRNFQLEQENIRLKGRLDDMLNWLLTNIRGTYPLDEQQLANLHIRPLNEEGLVSDDLAGFLKLSDEETGVMDAVFLDGRQILQEISAEGIFVDENEEELQVTVNIPSFPEDGQFVREELYRELQKTLGTARFDRLLQVAGSGLEEQFGYFGEASRQLQFTVLEGADGTDEQLFLRDEWVIPTGDPLQQDVKAREAVLAALPSEYLFYVDWLPDYMRQFIVP